MEIIGLFRFIVSYCYNTWCAYIYMAKFKSILFILLLCIIFTWQYLFVIISS